ncbi:MAG TPA: tetratricopeptide repeat protein, partial [Luteimonas sp.]|nr:tetratricopeptide repeat protein [Luteimonas sp.]
MAIDELLDEHEQGERVQAWLRHNAVGIIAGVVLALGLVGGWRWWQARLDQQQLQAGETYQSVLKAIEADDLAGAQSRAAALQGGTFSALVALDLARAQVGAGQRDA